MDDIHKLSYWLNEAEKEIIQILQQGKIEINKEKFNASYQFYQIKIRLGISQRDSCFKLYTNLINPKNDFLDKKKIKINNKPVTYHEVRHQLFIPLLILNTRLYEQCIILCYFLDTLEHSKKFYRLSDLLFKDFSKTFQNINSKNKIEFLRNNYSDYLNIILFFRNNFVHSKEYLNQEESFFISKNVENTDTLNLDVVKKSYLEDKKSRKIPDSKQYFDLLEPNEMKAGQIIEKCMEISDHYMGSLINHILKLRLLEQFINK